MHNGKAPSNKQKAIFLTSTIIIGITLIISGTGKLPGQTEFADALLKSFWTPSTAYVIVHYLPWLETILGILLLLGIFPGITAPICLLRFAGFISNNVWALANSAVFPECAYCFGIWESLFGSVSPRIALAIDIVLFALAIVILLLE